MKKCNACKQQLFEGDFRRGRSVCKKCMSLKQYHPEEFKKRFPSYVGREKKKKLYNIKFGERFKESDPPNDIVRCLNSIDDTLSTIHVEIKAMNNLLRDFLYNDK